MSFEKRAFDEATRVPVLNRTDGRCTYCGTTLAPENYGKCDGSPPPGAWEVDHWLPQSLFSDQRTADAFFNLWPACCRCNDEKGARDGEAYVLERITNDAKVNVGTVELLVSNATRMRLQR